MIRGSGRARAWVVLLLVALALAGCARSPEARKARHLQRGDAYFQRAQYRDAVLEYRNALRIEPGNARAIQQLGLAHFHAGEWGQALRCLVKAREVAPDSLEVRLRLGTIALAAGRHAEAHAEASAVLAREPRNVEALVLLAGRARAPDSVWGLTLLPLGVLLRGGWGAAAPAGGWPVSWRGTPSRPGARRRRACLAADNLAWLLAEHTGSGIRPSAGGGSTRHPAEGQGRTSTGSRATTAA